MTHEKIEEAYRTLRTWYDEISAEYPDTTEDTVIGGTGKAPLTFGMLEEAVGHADSFDLSWKSDMRAIERWQKAHPGKENTWPDRTDLVAWLMEQLEKKA